MKLSKFLALTFSITAVALFYVYQETQVFCLAYRGGEKSKVFQELLDKNNVLRYNINVITSMPRIGSKLLDEADFEIPSSERLVRLNSPQQQKKAPPKIPGAIARAVDFFSLKSQAEARTISR